ncbi:class I SAM-dependent methyltransferase [Oxalicibacterium faecigallinarum]|uniref:SAM-dependent methyltransferase n=1 Tax=Oxalicibacterium faecigallinarum TaxID=573741 RepID=A0A8J3AWV0_9BURK|nr:class I SAM-dependent methyltransferase [Oxalicibacterium faecigallinarum]GGI17718.1 SAM-dependent methyltransferase [Oxalicibacterium faecigallinarum]
MGDSLEKPDMHEALGQPSPWVIRFARLIPEGEVLDLACGTGRHSRLLASQGHPVLAVDRNADSLALAAGAGVQVMKLDLETGDLAISWPFAAGRFSGVVVTNYLHRPLWASLASCLKAGGVLIYETFALGNEQFGKPSNPDFLLARGELLDFAQDHDLRVIAFEDGCVTSPKPAMLQRICLVKRGDAESTKHFVLN